MPPFWICVSLLGFGFHFWVLWSTFSLSATIYIFDRRISVNLFTGGNWTRLSISWQFRQDKGSIISEFMQVCAYVSAVFFYYYSLVQLIVNLWLRPVDDSQSTGDTPLYQPYRSVCVAPKGRFFAPFWSETGMDVDHFGLESGMVFKGTTGVYERISCFNSKWVRKNEPCEFEILFCCCSILSNQITWFKVRSENGYGFQGPGLKTGVKNDIFWSEIGSGFEEPGLTPPPRIPRGSPGSQSKYMFNVLLLKSKRPTRIVF